MDLKKEPFNLTEKECQEISAKLQTMSQAEKAGQLFCILGDLYDPAEQRHLISDLGIGGVLLRPDKLSKIQSEYEALDKLAKIPLLKAANLEDGADGALSDGTRFSSEMGISATGDPSFAYKLGLSASYEARKAGVNVTFSPDCDIDFNYLNPITNERTYGSNPHQVRAFAVQEIKGFLANGMVPTVKHFPGDGVDFRDQHLHPTYNNLSYNLWSRTYGMVYRKAIKAGVPCFMAGHIVAPHLSAEVNPAISFKEALPASLAPELLQGLLRKRLHFNGLIFTDATIMGGFCQAMERSKAIPAAIAAGVDMIVFNTDIEEDYAYLLDGIKAGIVTPERLDEAVKRVLALKILIRHLQQIVPADVPSDTVRKLADSSITLVKNTGSELPLSHAKYDAVQLISLGNGSCQGQSLRELVRSRLAQDGYQVSFFDIDKVEMHGIGQLPRRTLVLYLANLETASNQTAVRIFWQKKHALDSPRFPFEAPAVFVSFANPYHLIDVPRIHACINAYTASEAVISSLIDKLEGLSPFKGQSPVDPFCGLEDTRI
jgi:beta-N-acetylhexosaminidase